MCDLLPFVLRGIGSGAAFLTHKRKLSWVRLWFRVNTNDEPVYEDGVRKGRSRFKIYKVKEAHRLWEAGRARKHRTARRQAAAGAPWKKSGGMN